MTQTQSPDLPISKSTLSWSRDYLDSCVRHPRLLRMLKVPFKVISGCAIPTPMLVRYRLLDTRFGSLNLHHFLRGDEDRDLHDHPFDFVTLVLSGGYREQLPGTGRRPGTGPCRFAVRRPGALLIRGAHWAHRVDLISKDAWTLIAMSKKRREWGFFTRGGWMPFKSYHSVAGCAESDEA